MPLVCAAVVGLLGGIFSESKYMSFSAVGRRKTGEAIALGLCVVVICNFCH